MDDRRVVEAQIGRPLRADSVVVGRCPLGLPLVVAVPPILDDGIPFPTRFWLTCPLASTRVGRLESIGGVRRMEAHADGDADFGRRLGEAHVRYERQRDEALETLRRTASDDGVTLVHEPSGGVAGSRKGVKCLHAHYADHVAGNDNPIGEVVAPWVEPLDCTTGCIVDGVKDPGWREPR